jgi:hypothetical protein
MILLFMRKYVNIGFMTEVGVSVSDQDPTVYSFGQPDPRLIGERAVVSAIEAQAEVPIIAGILATEYPTGKRAIQWKDKEDGSTYVACLRQAMKHYNCACCGEEITPDMPNVVRVRLHPEKIFPYDHVKVGHFDVTKEPGDIETAMARPASKTRNKDIESLRSVVMRNARKQAKRTVSPFEKSSGRRGTHKSDLTQ